jgi:F-type H+-transporting ATPase subunit b
VNSLLESLNSFKFVIAALNMIVLFLVLRKILFKPVTEFMEKRTKAIEDSIADAEKNKTKAAEMKNAYEAQLKAAKAESEKIIDAAVEKATREQERIVAEAQRQSEELLAKVREELELERKQMLRDVRSEVANLAFAAASKVMEANMDNESNRKLVSRFIDEAGAA